MRAHAQQRLARQRGFTLIEVLITAAVLVIVVIGLGATGGIATRTMHTTDRRADLTERVQKFFQRINSFSRSGVLSTYKVQATAADVAAARATAVGDWIDPVDGEARSDVRFSAADGILAMSAASITPPIELHFVLDGQENPATNAGAVAGSDDDGDGWIDEGRIQMHYDGTDAVLVSGIESCAMTIVGHQLTVAVRTARRGATDRQFTFEQVFMLRNN